MRTFLTGVAACSAAFLALCTAPAAAQGYTATVVASNLNSPRGIAFGPDGALYIAESGVPGSGFNTSGSITRLRNGVQEPVVVNLASLTGPMGEATGPQDIAFGSDGFGYVLFGLGTDPQNRSTTLGGGAANALGSLFRFTPGGVPTFVADIAANERTNNPAGGAFDSNPFHLVSNGTGFLITDAGSNTLLSISATGALLQTVVFPQHQVGPVPLADPVPTGVAIGPGGSYYVAELTGAPFSQGAANIYELATNGTVLRTLSGFTNITDIAFGADGSLYVLEYDADGIPFGGSDGALIKVGTDGSRQTIFSQGLIRPTGLAIAGNGDLYVSAFSTSGGGGQVFQIAAVPEPGSWAMLILGFGVVGAAMRRGHKAVRVPAA